jgi:hypothetical protein
MLRNPIVLNAALNGIQGIQKSRPPLCLRLHSLCNKKATGPLTRKRPRRAGPPVRNLWYASVLNQRNTYMLHRFQGIFKSAGCQYPSKSTWRRKHETHIRRYGPCSQYAHSSRGNVGRSVVRNGCCRWATTAAAEATFAPVLVNSAGLSEHTVANCRWATTAAAEATFAPVLVNSAGLSEHTVANCRWATAAAAEATFAPVLVNSAGLSEHTVANCRWAATTTPNALASSVSMKCLV